MTLPIKEALLALYLVAGFAAVAERLLSLGPGPALFLYVGLFGFLAVCLLLAAYIRNTHLRLGYAVLLSASALLLDSFQRIVGEPLTYDAFINLLNSAGFVGDTLGQHASSIASAFASSLLLLVGVAMKPKRTLPLPGSASVAAPLIGIATLSGILFARGGEGANGLPSAFPILAYSSVFLYERGVSPTVARQDVTIPRTGPRARGDIALIIDESVLGSYLDINDARGATSGLARSRPGVEIHNFGYAASITNCSVGTNVTLRHGGTRDDYERINATMPAIWRYARKAGLRTVYIDAQRTGGNLHNLMSRQELEAIDRFIQFDDVPVRERDMAAADVLARLLNDRTADFIIINKVGAHFPIHDKYPDAFMRHRPALPRGGFADVSDTGSRDGFGGSSEDWARYRNAYRNTLLWNVGAFFDRLFARARIGDATIIYTSDHGQDLHEAGNPGLDTHCSSDPVIEEGLVPLVVIKGATLKTLDWERNLGANRNRVSHYEIFPTLLSLMGYDGQRVRAVYGPSLLERSTGDPSFNARFNARLGLKPRWIAINSRSITATSVAQQAKLQDRAGQLP